MCCCCLRDAAARVANVAGAAKADAVDALAVAGAVLLAHLHDRRAVERGEAHVALARAVEARAVAGAV